MDSRVTTALRRCFAPANILFGVVCVEELNPPVVTRRAVSAELVWNEEGLLAVFVIMWTEGCASCATYLPLGISLHR